MKKFLVSFFFISTCCFGQNEQAARNAFMSSEIIEAFDYWNISKPNTNFHSSFKPYLSRTFLNATDSVVPFKFYAFKNFFLSKTLNENSNRKNKVNIQVHPIADAEFGYDMLLQKPIITALGGTHLKINLNNDFTFAATVVGGQSQLPFFLDTTSSKQRILSAYGQTYGNHYTFFDYTGYISYSPNNNKYFNFQLGRDKHFIGDGYRSLLLSDFSPANPYFGINTNIWRLQYNVWYSWMYDVTNANGIKSNFNNKYGTFHYLSYNVNKNFSFGLFENIVWRGTDSNQVRTFEVNYLNPVIFLRPQEYSVGSPDNSFMGLNMNATISKKIKLYGQLALDEFYLKEIKAHKGWWANKQGWQLGAKYINSFGIKGLKLQAEYNEVRPYTYTHGLPAQNYAHYGMPLAHPLGANFREFLGFINYRKDKWEIALQGMYAMVGKDTANTNSNVGQNIFLSYTTRNNDYGNYTTQGIKTTLMQSQLKFTYYIIPDMNMRVEATYIQRSERNTQGYVLQNPFLSLAFKTSFWNVYRDY